MNIVLPPDLAAIVEKFVRTGAYRTPEEVITAALIRADEGDEFAGLTGDELRSSIPGMNEEIARGLEDIRAGRLTDGDAVFKELELDDTSAPITGRKSA